jgi:hypothetical protein
MREAGRDDVGELERRSPEEWRAAETATMAAIRRARPRRTVPAVRWAIGVAAALLVVALAMPFRSRAPVAGGPEVGESADAAGASDVLESGFASAADRDDDALLRDAEYLAQGGDDHADFPIEENL